MVFLGVATRNLKVNHNFESHHYIKKEKYVGNVYDLVEYRIEISVQVPETLPKIAME